MHSVSLRMLIAVCVALVGACKKDEKKSEAPSKSDTESKTATAGGDKAGGARELAVEVGDHGYVPSELSAAAGEQLALIFTRKSESECGRFVRVDIENNPDNKVELPLNEPVRIDVTMPADGELVFTCGMDMMTGKIVVAAR